MILNCIPTQYSLKIVFLYCFLLSGSLWSVELSNITDHKAIGKEISILEDRLKSITIDDIQTQNTNLRFVPSTEDIPNFGQTNFHYWIKIPFENKSPFPTKRLLEIDYSNIDLVEVYSESNGKFHLTDKEGMMFPFSERKIKNRNFVFSVVLDKQSAKTIYIKLYNSGGLTLPLTVWTEESFSLYYADIQHGLGLYYGVMIVMILYNFFIFLSVKDISYLYYVTYILGFLGLQLILTGHGFQYLWPNVPEFQRNGFVIFSGFCIASLLLFTRRFLNTKVNTPRWLDQPLRIFFVLHIIEIPLTFLLSPEITVKLGLLLILPVPILIFIAAIISFLRRYRAARFSFSPSMFSLVYPSL